MKTQQINGYEAYRISTNGVLESCWVWGPYYPGMESKPRWKKLPLRENADGYIPINLRGVGGKGRRTHLHRLLAETFISAPPFPNACVRHMDGNPRNNDIGNLSWGTYQENEDDKLRHGTHAKRISNGKLTRATMGLARKMAEAGATQQQIARKIGVSRPTISRFLSGRTWQ